MPRYRRERLAIEPVGAIAIRGPGVLHRPRLMLEKLAGVGEADARKLRIEHESACVHAAVADGAIAPLIHARILGGALRDQRAIAGLARDGQGAGEEAFAIGAQQRRAQAQAADLEDEACIAWSQLAAAGQ